MSEGHFRRAAVLKSDVFSTIERGHWVDASGEAPAIRRDLSTARWWALLLALHFAARETRALARAGGIAGVPRLLHASRREIVRGFVDGLPMQLAKPHGQPAFFRDAKRILREMRRTGLCHNDLAKEPNWLVLPDGRAGVTDFQLASVHARKGRLFRLLAHEDLRHLLKHKRSYCPEALTARERAMLAKKSLPARLWLATGKRVYMLITRELLKTRDREGGGVRLNVEAPRLAAALAALAGVSGAAVVGYPYRRKGVGLYAFVETERTADEIRWALPRGLPPAPELIQTVEKLPRRADGTIHDDILRLIAMNQIDLIEPLVAGDAELRACVEAIAVGRQNLTDRRIKA